jgi:hypothetical protein
MSGALGGKGLRISRNITKDDFGERYQEVEGMR